jgi:ribonuclease Z
MIRVIFLGTAGSFPTVNRSLPAIAIQRDNELFLFDCGEGVQRQMFIAQIGFRYKLKIFITHMHGDHILGLPGLLQTMSLFRFPQTIHIYGPQGLCEFLEAIVKTLKFHLTFPVEVEEVGEGLVCETDEYMVHAIWSEHKVPNLAYALIEKQRTGKFYPEKARSLDIPEGPMWSKLQRGEEVILSNGRVIPAKEVIGPQRPGRKIVYSGDTKPSSNLIQFAKDADLLIYEATFDDNLSERAEENGHSTPSQAAFVAKRAKVKRLVLTHIGSRYDDSFILLKQAQRTFSKVMIAEDFMELKIKRDN